MAEGAPLLREYGLKAHRGFESLSLRQKIKKAAFMAVFLFPVGVRDENPHREAIGFDKYAGSVFRMSQLAGEPAGRGQG